MHCITWDKLGFCTVTFPERPGVGVLRSWGWGRTAALGNWLGLGRFLLRRKAYIFFFCLCPHFCLPGSGSGPRILLLHSPKAQKSLNSCLESHRKSEDGERYWGLFTNPKRIPTEFGFHGKAKAKMKQREVPSAQRTLAPSPGGPALSPRARARIWEWGRRSNKHGRNKAALREVALREERRQALAQQTHRKEVWGVE